MFERLKDRIATGWGYKEASAGARDPKKTLIKRIGMALKGRGGSEFEEAPIDLNEVTKAYNTDSYVKRAVDKYSELMFKAGWEISGKDDAITEYVWTRIKLMEEATRQSIDDLFKEISTDLVLYGNAFVVKARQSGSGSTSGIKAVGYTGNKPIAGYFVLSPTSIQIARDDTGKITSYQQDTGGGGDKVVIKPEDMIHFTHKKPRGRAFGMPYIWPALGDVKLLRQAEENVSRLIYRNLFPLYQYKIGLDKPGWEAAPEEIEETREQIRNMPMDGALVTSERHNISAVSSNSAIMNVDPYLKFFRQRVFSGLGVSDIIMGIGDTANRGTADNLSSEMIDGVKEFQSVFRNVFQREIVYELLFEGGYDPVMNPEHEIEFNFHEIELDSKIKKENHLVQMFTQNALTHEELRSQLGLDPVVDEQRLYFNMITIQTALQIGSAEAGSDDAEAANAQGRNKDQPTNQNGTQSSPKASSDGAKGALSESSNVNENDFSEKALTEQNVMVNLHSELKVESAIQSLKPIWNAFREDTLNMIRIEKDPAQIEAFVVQLVKQNVRSRLERTILESYTLGAMHASQELQKFIPYSKTQLESNKLSRISTAFSDRLVADLKSRLFLAMEEEKMTDRLAKASAVFETNEFRIRSLMKTEIYRAYNFGLAIAARDLGRTTVDVIHEANCAVCKAMDNTVDLLSPGLLDAIPPHHTNCSCIIKLQPAEGV